MWLIVGQTRSLEITVLSCCKNVIVGKNLVMICLVLYLSLEFRPLVFTTRHCSVQAEPGCLGNTQQQTQTLLQSKIMWCSLTPGPRPASGCLHANCKCRQGGRGLGTKQVVVFLCTCLWCVGGWIKELLHVTLTIPT